MQPTINLVQIARDANREHDEVVASLSRGLEHARRAGELLNQAKGAVPHGQWAAWLGEHFVGSDRTARLYMRIAREWPKLDAETGNGVANLPLREAARRLASEHKSGRVTITRGGKIMEIREPKVITLPPVVIETQLSELEELTHRTMEVKSSELEPLTHPPAVIIPSMPSEVVPSIRRCESLQRSGRALMDAVHAEHPQRTGPVSYVRALLNYSDTRTPADLAAALEPFSGITAADIEQLVAWLSDAAIALDRRVGQGEARQG